MLTVNPSDFHFATWRADGVPIGLGFGLNTSLSHFTARGSSVRSSLEPFNNRRCRIRQSWI